MEGVKSDGKTFDGTIIAARLSCGKARTVPLRNSKNRAVEAGGWRLDYARAQGLQRLAERTLPIAASNRLVCGLRARRRAGHGGSNAGGRAAGANKPNHQIDRLAERIFLLANTLAKTRLLPDWSYPIPNRSGAAASRSVYSNPANRNRP